MVYDTYSLTKTKGSLMTKLFLLIGLLFSLNTWAFDTSRCPTKISLEIKNSKVFFNARHNAIPGWIKAQENLRNLGVFQTTYNLIKKNPRSCQYVNSDGDKALFYLRVGHGTGDNYYEPYTQQKIEVLAINFSVKGSKYMTHINVKDYSPNSLVFYSKPAVHMVKASIYSAQNNNRPNIDIGNVVISLRIDR